MLSDGPLDETIIEDVSDSIGTEFRSKYGFITAICVIAATFFTGFVINELLNANGNEILLRFYSYMFIVALLPILVPMTLWFYLSRGVRERFINQLCDALGFEHATDLAVNMSGAAVFASGEDHMKTELLVGSYRGYLLDLYTHTYWVQAGKHKAMISETVCELTYDKPLPHILLNFDNTKVAGMEPVELEGGFNDTFSLRVEKGKQMEVREIFQPDVMEDLEQNFRNVHVEFFTEFGQSKMYIAMGELLDNRAQLLALVRTTDTLIDRILPGLEAVGRDSTSAGELKS